VRSGSLLLFGCLGSIAAACGSRTGLLGDAIDGGVTLDAPGEAAQPADAISSPSPEEDAARDEDADLGVADSTTVDVPAPADVAATGCTDATASSLYVITDQRNLFSFDPLAALFTSIAQIQCPTPFFVSSMAVDRTGTAYVAAGTGEVFRVSTTTAACATTGFVSTRQGFALQFGMAFSADATGGGETLYLAEGFRSFPRLAALDTTTFALRVIGTLDPTIQSPELTGTGAGELFAFYDTGGSASAIGRIDKTTAQLISKATLPGVTQGSGWAFAFWGGDFYVFTAPPLGPGSTVTRFRPSDGSIMQVAQIAERIVGAGVSTCAPQH
jgi:hypothetical protein